MRIIKNKIIFSKKEICLIKKVMAETEHMAECLSTWDYRAMLMSEILKK